MTAGFTATVVVAAEPAKVFAYFIDPARFGRWFAVDGFTTPADEIDLDPTPGGVVRGVMVSVEDATRLPFQLRYGRLDPPHLAQFVFDEAEDAVTLDIRPTDDGRTRVSYHKPYGPADGIVGARSMLDALEASIRAAAQG